MSGGSWPRACWMLAITSSTEGAAAAPTARARHKNATHAPMATRRRAPGRAPPQSPIVATPSTNFHLLASSLLRGTGFSCARPVGPGRTPAVPVPGQPRRVPGEVPLLTMDSPEAAPAGPGPVAGRAYEGTTTGSTGDIFSIPQEPPAIYRARQPRPPRGLHPPARRHIPRGLCYSLCPPPGEQDARGVII